MLTLETAEQCPSYWDIIGMQALSRHLSSLFQGLGTLAGWRGCVWLKAWLVFQMGKVCGCREPSPGFRGLNLSCVTSGKLHLTSLDLNFSHL